jgi:putative transposase
MKRKRFTEEQIIGLLREHDLGAKTADLCRKHGISEATFYNWKSKFGGLDVSAAVSHLSGRTADGAQARGRKKSRGNRGADPRPAAGPLVARLRSDQLACVRRFRILALSTTAPASVWLPWRIPRCPASGSRVSLIF